MKIYFTSTAQASLNSEADFILEKWNIQEVEKFLTLVNDFIERLSENPYLGKKSDEKEIRIFVLSKQTTVIYKVQESLNRIDILFFWNNKREPKRLP
jgi:plasmid stabilization system protein ParE